MFKVAFSIFSVLLIVANKPNTANLFSEAVILPRRSKHCVRFERERGEGEQRIGHPNLRKYDILFNLDVK